MSCNLFCINAGHGHFIKKHPSALRWKMPSALTSLGAFTAKDLMMAPCQVRCSMIAYKDRTTELLPVGVHNFRCWFFQYFFQARCWTICWRLYVTGQGKRLLTQPSPAWKPSFSSFEFYRRILATYGILRYWNSQIHKHWIHWDKSQCVYTVRS